MVYQPTPLRMTLPERQKIASIGEAVEKRQSHFWWKCKLVQPLIQWKII